MFALSYKSPEKVSAKIINKYMTELRLLDDILYSDLIIPSVL